MVGLVALGELLGHLARLIHLADDQVAGALADLDLGARLLLVLPKDDELPRIPAHRLVFRDGDLDAGLAVHTVAFTDDLEPRFGDAPAKRGVLDALVHMTKQGLVLGDALGGAHGGAMVPVLGRFVTLGRGACTWRWTVRDDIC